jgi:adenosylhomocysteine nucleosidase
MTVVVPAGPEERAVRRGAVRARIVAVPAGRRAADCVAELPSDALVVVLGLCGGLQNASMGSTVIYTDVVDDATSIAVDPVHVHALMRALPSAPIARACTTDHVVTNAAERAVLASQYGADVVDMEGTYLAAALRARALPFAMVRVVSDDSANEMPAIGDAIDPGGKIRPWRVAAAFARRPFAAVRFVVDVRWALATLGEVAAAVTRVAG